MQKLIAVGAALLAGFVGCGLMLILGVGESTAAMVGAAAAGVCTFTGSGGRL